MSREANCQRMRGVIRALAREGCDERHGRSLPISRIAQVARIEAEAAKTTIKTLRRRGWLLRVQFNVSGNLYRLSAPPQELLRMTRNTQATAPTHYDALIAAGVEAEDGVKELQKMLKSIREPKGQTHHAIAENVLRQLDALQEVADRLVLHAAEHCGMNGQGDFVDEAKRSAKEAEAEIVDVEAEPLFDDDEEVDGSAEALPESPLGLEWSDAEEKEEGEDDDDEDDESDCESAESDSDERGAA